MKSTPLALLLAVFLLFGVKDAAADAAPNAEVPQRLLHVSFGFTKAFYADYNRWFAEKWLRETGQRVIIEQSHGPSGMQTEAVIAGKLQPDVLSLASPTDLDAIAAKTGLVDKEWRTALPNESSPYYSAVVFLVRRGNPKGIHDWPDLALEDRTLITSDPKACGGGRWNYAAAFGIGARAEGEQVKKDAYLASFLHNVPKVYANQGEAGEAFLKLGQGDVLLTYEAFALSVSHKPDAPVELVVPARSVEIELPVAIARKVTERNKTTKLAETYLRGLYDPEVQALFAKHLWRPRSKAVAKSTASAFPQVTLVKAETVFGARDERTHLSSGGTFDRLIQVEAGATAGQQGNQRGAAIR